MIICVGICSFQSVASLNYVLIPSHSRFPPCAVTSLLYPAWFVCTVPTTYHRSPSHALPQSLYFIAFAFFSTRSQFFACLPACSCLFIAFVLRVYNLVHLLHLTPLSLRSFFASDSSQPRFKTPCIIYATYQCSSSAVLIPIRLSSWSCRRLW